MKDFSFSLRLDSPLLQSGALSKEIDSTRTLRGPSIRGLLHTFARAAIGPYLAGNSGDLFKAEQKLLGGASGVGEATFRLDVTGPKFLDEPFPNRPGGQKSERRGHPDGNQRVRVMFRPRPNACCNDTFPQALLAVAWLAFTFGSLGNRARRGYGSLTISSLEGAPAGVDLPTWPEPPADGGVLRARLSLGLATAQQLLGAWLDENRVERAKTLSPSGEYKFFMLSTPDQIRVSETFKSWRPALEALMDASSDQMARQPALFSRTVGSAGRPRLSSPLWCRLYRVGQGTGVVLVSTFSPVDRDHTAVDAIRDAVSAGDRS